jgi:hypothetical protein
MPTMTLTNSQVVDLVKQLPPQDKRAALYVLAEEAAVRRQIRYDFAEAQLKQRCAERGLNWNSLSDEERENFIDDLLHEDK